MIKKYPISNDEIESSLEIVTGWLNVDFQNRWLGEAQMWSAIEPLR